MEFGGVLGWAWICSWIECIPGCMDYMRFGTMYLCIANGVGFTSCCVVCVLVDELERFVAGYLLRVCVNHAIARGFALRLYQATHLI